MVATKIEQFGGMLPAWDDHLLPAGQGALAVNTYLFSGSLIGWRKPKLLRQLTNSLAKYAYRVPTIAENVAGAYIVFPDNPSEGDTVTLGDEIYKFTATVSVAYDVLIGANSGASRDNLYAAFTVDDGTSANEGVLYGSGCVGNPAISAVVGHNTKGGSGLGPYIHVEAPDFGAAFNNTPVSESTGGLRTTWLYDLVSLTHTTASFTGGTNATFDSTITGSATWLEFDDPDTDVMRSPVVDDQFDRYYFASPSVPPKYNTAARIAAAENPFLLGLPPPGCAPIVSVVGGGSDAILGFPNNDGTGTQTLLGNYLYLIPINPTGSMQLNDISFLPAGTNSTVNFIGVLYADNAGSPGDLINVGAQVTGVTANQQAVSAFLAPTGLLTKTKYWIGIMADDAIGMNRADPGATGILISSTYTNGPPPIAPTGTAANDFQVWGDLTTSDVIEARAYVYTWLSAYAEESPPSPATLVNGWSNGTWTIALYLPPSDYLGVTRNVTGIRVYRTVSSAGGATVYYWVCDVDIPSNTISNVTTATGITNGTATIVGPLTVQDTLGDDVVALNNQLASTNWFPPPEGLQGIRSMPNGMAVGFKGNELWFCEPYRPHAWPPGYVLTTEFPIVGIGVTGQSVVACTSGTPYVGTGVSPSVLTLNKIHMPEPCISRGSVVGTLSGVFYQSHNGLILVPGDTTAASNVTEMWITRERWNSLAPQKNTRAIPLASCYFCFGTTNGTDNSVAQSGFNIEMNQDNQSFTIWPQPGGHRIGFNQMTGPNGFDIDNVMVDPWTGIGLLIQDGGIYYYDFTDATPAIVPYKFRTKIYQQVSKKNFEAMKVFFTVPVGTPTQGVRNEKPTTDPSWGTLGPNQYGIVRVYGDGNLVTTREIYKSGELLRVLSGFKYEDWQFEFEGRVLISNVQIATSVKELGSI